MDKKEARPAAAPQGLALWTRSHCRLRGSLAARQPGGRRGCGHSLSAASARQSRSRSESRWPAGARARAAATRGCQSLCPAPLASLAGSVPRDCRELEA